MGTHTLTRILRLDAAANVVAGAGIVAASGWLAGPLGLGSGWPLLVVGLALVAYGMENLAVSHRTSAAGLTALIFVDLTFAAVVLGIAIVDPTSAETWTRWSLAAVADLSAVFGIAKFVGLRGLGPEPREAT